MSYQFFTAFDLPLRVKSDAIEILPICNFLWEELSVSYCDLVTSMIKE